MEYLIKNKSEIIKMGNNSYSYAQKNFDQKITNKKNFKLYENHKRKIKLIDDIHIHLIDLTIINNNFI